MAKRPVQRARRRGSPPSVAPPRSTGKRWPGLWWGLAGVALIAVGVYGNALDNGFVWDDPIIVERQLVVFDSLTDVFVTPRGIPHYSPDYYRPTTTASYLLDRWLGGGEPWAFHGSVVVAHAAVSVLVALLSLQLLEATTTGIAASLVAGVLFALHPVHPESVAWAAGRSDVLATLFALAVLVMLGRERIGAGTVLASGICAFAALGAKEVAVVVYPLLLLRALLDPSIGWDRRSVSRYAGVGVALIAYLALRRLTIGEIVGEQPGETSMWSVLPSVFWALGGYLRELVWPLPYNAYIDTVPRGPGALAGLAGLAGALGWSVFRWRVGDWRWLYVTLWIPLAVTPSLVILWKIPEVPMAERYAYLPSVGICTMAGLLFFELDGARRWWSRAAFVALSVLAAVTVWQRNPVWRDDVSLWQDTVARTEVSGMAWRSLGAAYLRESRLEDAEVALRRALTMRNPPLGLQGIYSNLGMVGMHRQDFSGARRAYEKALQLTPDAPDILFNLGLSIFYGGGRDQESARASLEHFQRAAQLSPFDPDLDVVLGQVFLTLGDRARARMYLQAALDKGVRPETRKGVEALLGEIEGGT